MTLSAGTRLGPYEILSAIGAGGMGEVYRARDPRLNRLIAIKLLPATAAKDAERRERFEREARAIGALNHPGIVTIYSVEQADGQFFLTMELVEGHALTEPFLGVACRSIVCLGFVFRSSTRSPRLIRKASRTVT